MTILSHLGLPLLDVVALVFMLTLWTAYTLYSTRFSGQRNSLRNLMQAQRLVWMREMCKRENRIVDATIVGNQLRGVSFFASTTVLLLAGLLGLMGVDQGSFDSLASFQWASPESVSAWKVKVAVLAALMTYAFFRFTWSMRQYQFVGVLIGAAPSVVPAAIPSAMSEEADASAEHVAARAAGVASSAAYAFNTGLRAYYFTLAALGWFVHPHVMMAMSIFVVVVLYRREFYSRTVADLLG